MATLCVPSTRERSKGLGVEVGGPIVSWHAPSVAFQRARAAALAEPLRLEEVNDAIRRHQTPSVLAGSRRARDCLVVASSTGSAADRVSSSVRSLDGSGNNRQHDDWGKAGTPYSRVTAAFYADRVGTMAAGPSPRRISNRLFNDLGQNVFSENNISQWGWTWGQFIDHDLGLRDETPAESAPIQFDASDPLEGFHNVGTTLAAPGRVRPTPGSRRARSAATSTQARSTGRTRVARTG
jgi:hypothetical protein